MHKQLLNTVSAVLLLASPLAAQADHSKMQHPTKQTDKTTAEQHQPLASVEARELIEGAPSNLLPQMGNTRQFFSGQTYTLQQLEEMALRNNPTIVQADAEIVVAGGRALQAGLYPNPTVGYTGEELGSGSSQQGVFVEQTIVLGGKLRAARAVSGHNRRLAEIEAEEQRTRVLNSVRLGYLQVLAAQEQVAIAEANARLAAETYETAQRLLNLGMMDMSEVMQAEITLHEAALAAKLQQNTWQHQWHALQSVIGDPALDVGYLDGRLDRELPVIDEGRIMAALTSTSPAIRLAQVAIERAEAESTSAKKQAIPDLQLRGGWQHNRELLEGSDRRVGSQGFVEVGVQIPLFNRNQGNVRAAQAEADRARAEMKRLSLVLRERAAEVARVYSDAQSMVNTYSREILPRAREIYELQIKAWGRMATSYPQVLAAQQRLFDLQTKYIGALHSLRASAITLEGFLLTDGLEPPARPEEMDLAIRELNLPAARGQAATE